MSCPLGTIYWGCRATVGVVADPTASARTLSAERASGSYDFDGLTGDFWYIAIPVFMRQPRSIHLEDSPLYLLPIVEDATIDSVAYKVYRALIALIPDDLVWVVP